MFQPGPLFNHLVLADEINRAPAKVQSALLEAMAEHQITVGKKSWRLPSLFMVAATQNPIEQEGTYPLPEAQLDRFLLKLLVDYPSPAMELAILQLNARGDALPTPPVTLSQSDLLEARTAVQGYRCRGASSTIWCNWCAPPARQRPVPRVEPLIRGGCQSQGQHRPRKSRTGPGLARRARLRAARRHPATGASRAAPPPHPELSGAGGQPR